MTDDIDLSLEDALAMRDDAEPVELVWFGYRLNNGPTLYVEVGQRCLELIDGLVERKIVASANKPAP